MSERDILYIYTVSKKKVTKTQKKRRADGENMPLNEKRRKKKYKKRELVIKTTEKKM